MSNFSYTVEVINNKTTRGLGFRGTTYRVVPTFYNTEPNNVMRDLLDMFTQLANEFKAELHPNNDRIGITMDHPDIYAKGFHVSFCRPKILTGEVLVTRFNKLLQSQESILLDGAMTFKVTTKKGPRGRGYLKLKNAKNCHDFFKRKRGIAEIDNTDNLCLPRAIVVGQAYIKCYVEKSISEYEYRKFKGTGGVIDDIQGRLARTLCARVGLDADEYVRGEKVFGMDEIKLFAEALLPEYGLVVHNSFAANAKIYESTPTSNKWINILNLGDHYSPITSPSGFFGKNYWCEQCNKVYDHKTKHTCIDNCQACKTLDTQSCQFYLGKLKKFVIIDF